MPSITTHHIFANIVFDHLTKKEKSLIEDEKLIYTTFAQSHDYLFYYTFDIKNFKWIRNLGHYAHHYHTANYILNIINEIKNEHLEYNKQCVAYLYGVITHYVLDSTCHPFIFYKTGIYRKENKLSKVYRGEHNRMEKDLDAIYYERHYKKKYNHCNLNRDIIKNPTFSKELSHLIDYAYKKTYKKENISTFYLRSIKHTKIINSIVINNYLGFKRIIYSFIDFITRKRFGNLSAYSTYRRHPDLSFLNNEHNTWNHPSIKDQKYNYSFDDLLDISLKKALTIIKAINKVLYEDKDIKTLLNVIPNIDYSTGLIIDENIRMDYFERGI